MSRPGARLPSLFLVGILGLMPLAAAAGEGEKPPAADPSTPSQEERTRAPQVQGPIRNLPSLELKEGWTLSSSVRVMSNGISISCAVSRKGDGLVEVGFGSGGLVTSTPTGMVIQRRGLLVTIDVPMTAQGNMLEILVDGRSHGSHRIFPVGVVTALVPPGDAQQKLQADLSEGRQARLEISGTERRSVALGLTGSRDAMVTLDACVQGLAARMAEMIRARQRSGEIPGAVPRPVLPPAQTGISRTAFSP